MPSQEAEGTAAAASIGILNTNTYSAHYAVPYTSEDGDTDAMHHAPSYANGSTHRDQGQDHRNSHAPNYPYEMTNITGGGEDDNENHLPDAGVHETGLPSQHTQPQSMHRLSVPGSNQHRLDGGGPGEGAGRSRPLSDALGDVHVPESHPHRPNGSAGEGRTRTLTDPLEDVYRQTRAPAAQLDGSLRDGRSRIASTNTTAPQEALGHSLQNDRHLSSDADYDSFIPGVRYSRHQPPPGAALGSARSYAGQNHREGTQGIAATEHR